MPRRIIVHFGPSIYVAGWIHQQGPGGRPIREDEHHLSFDVSASLKERLGAFSGNTINLDGRHGAEGRSTVVFRDARHTGLRAGSAHEVHIHNVLSTLTPKRRQEMLAEAKRLLRPDGVIYVSETLTPHLHPLYRLLDAAAQAGLSARVLANGSALPTRPLSARRKSLAAEQRIIADIVGRNIATKDHPDGTTTHTNHDQYYLTQLTPRR